MKSFKVGPRLKAYFDSRSPDQREPIRVKLTISEPLSYPPMQEFAQSSLEAPGARQVWLRKNRAPLQIIGRRFRAIFAHARRSFEERYGELPPRPTVSRAAIFLTVPPEGVAALAADNGISEIELARSWRPNEH